MSWCSVQQLNRTRSRILLLLPQCQYRDEYLRARAAGAASTESQLNPRTASFRSKDVQGLNGGGGPPSDTSPNAETGAHCADVSTTQHREQSRHGKQIRPVNHPGSYAPHMPTRTRLARQRKAKLADMESQEPTPPTVYDQLKAQNKDESIALQWKAGEIPTVILAVDSEKGGVTKTATVTALAAVAADHDLSVLVIDLDPRATATDELGQWDRENKRALPQFTVNDILAQETDDPAELKGTAADAIVPAGEGWPENVHLLAAERNLSNRESDLSMGIEHRLKFALQGVAEHYDLVLIDMPPRAGGQLVKIAFNAATHVIMPATLEEDGFVGAKDALGSLRTHNAYAPNPISIVGIFRSLVDGRQTSIAALYDAKIREEFDDLFIEDAIVGKYTLRTESRSGNIPITAGKHTPEGVKLIRGYIQVLNAVRRSV